MRAVRYAAPFISPATAAAVDPAEGFFVFGLLFSPANSRNIRLPLASKESTNAFFSSSVRGRNPKSHAEVSVFCSTSVVRDDRGIRLFSNFCNPFNLTDLADAIPPCHARLP